MIASALGERGWPGLRYWLRTGRPVFASRPGTSMKSRAAGVAMTCTSHPRCWARSTSRPTSAAGPSRTQGHDDVQDAGVASLAHKRTPICVVNSLTCLLMLGGDVVRRSRRRRWTAGRAETSSGVSCSAARRTSYAISCLPHWVSARQVSIGRAALRSVSQPGAGRAPSVAECHGHEAPITVRLRLVRMWWCRSGCPGRWTLRRGEVRR